MPLWRRWSASGAIMSGTAADLKDRSGSQIEEAYWLLRREILSGVLAPGEKLRIEYLRGIYGFGASGIREALSRLLADGLVEAEAQRGFWVCQISRQDLRDITLSRRILEVEALRQAIAHGDMEWESRVVAARYMLERLEKTLTVKSVDAVKKWEDANRQFHMALLSGCPIQRLLRFTEQLYDQSLRYRHRTALRRSFPRSGISRDHEDIVEATLMRDADRASDLLSAHIDSIAQIAEEAIFGREKK
jgi:DNA-binding GntR family transcriptional regulator